jgi:hypothetical protein
MGYCVINLNEDQAKDFLKKYMQDNISVVNLSYDDEDGIYFVELKSGKLFNRIHTHWQWRGFLCFGSYEMPMAGKRFDIAYPDKELIEKASIVVKDYIDKWNKISPV